MKKIITLFVLFLFVNFSFLLSQGAQTTIPCPAGTVATTLPANGFSGQNPTTAAGSCGQCCYAGSDLDNDGDQDVSFSVENSKWFKFCNSGATTLTQTFTVDETANNCNLQGAIFVGGSASPNNASDALDVDCGNTFFSEFGSNVSGNADGFSFSNVDIAPGQCAYIMVDGYGGATCLGGFSISTSCTVCTAPTSITESADITICEGSSTNLTAVAVGGVVAAAPGTVYYSWTPTTALTPANGISQNVAAAPTGTTTYTVRACNDGVGTTCCTSDIVNVTVTPTFIANAGADITSCAPSTVTIGGTPTGPAGSTYSWAETGANANIAISGSSTVSNPSVAISAGATGSATYTVTVTNGPCVRTDAVVVTVGTLAVNAGASVTMCAGTTTSIGGLPTAPAGSTFSWVETSGDNTTATSGSVTLSATNIANPIVTANAAFSGIVRYTVTATLSGCSNTSFVDVVVSAIPTTPTATASISPICAGNSSTLTAAGGAGAGTYTWWTAATGGVQLGSANTLIVNPVATTTYFIQSTDGTSLCNSLRGSVTVTVNPTPVANAGADLETCQNTALNLAGTITNPGACGPPNQTWSIVAGTGTFSNANLLTSTFTPTSTGTITLRLTPCSPGGCTPVADDVTLTVNPAPTVVASATDFDFCESQLTDLSAVASGGTPAPPTITTNSFTSAVGPFAIPDNNSDGVVIPISVTGISNATLGTTDISNLSVNVDHNRIGQVEVWLCPPGIGTTSPYTGCILLFNNHGGNGDDMVNTVFSDAGTTDIASGTVPYTGTFNLTGANVFTSLDGSPTNGTWNVVVLDNSNAGNTSGTAGQMGFSLSTPTPALNPYTYQWSNATGLIAPTNTEGVTLSASSFVAPTAITKTITVTDSEGCTATDDVVINLRITPTMTITSGTTDLCPAAAGVGSSSTNVSIDFTGTQSWTYTPVEDNVNDTPITTNSDPTTISYTYAEIVALGDQTMVLSATDFTDNYCPGDVVNSHTITAFCILPIELVSFSGTNINRKNELKWITSSETNNSHFYIEKSEDGINYQFLDKIDSKNNNSITLTEYNAVDVDPFKKHTYYRLHQVDLNGKETFISLLKISINDDNKLSYAPNPVTDYLNLTHFSNIDETKIINVIDIYGNNLYSETINCKKGKNESLIKFENFPEGVYLVTIKNDVKIETIKISKIKN